MAATTMMSSLLLAWTRAPELILMRHREEEAHKRNDNLGTQDPVPSHKGMLRLSFWMSNVWAEDDNRKLDCRRVFQEEWGSMRCSKWVGKHIGEEEGRTRNKKEKNTRQKRKKERKEQKGIVQMH